MSKLRIPKKHKEKHKKQRPSIRNQMMAMNIGIILAAFVLLGLLFVLSVGLLLKKSVNRDLDFFLTKISENLSAKTEYMEQMLYDVRKSRDVISFLNGSKSSDYAQAVFSDVVDINSDKNLDDTGMPLVDKIYVFNSKGDFLADYYYALIYAEENAANLYVKQFSSRFNDLLDRGLCGQFYCLPEKKYIYMAASILDDNMEEMGSIVYVLNRSVIESIMQETEIYDRSYWIVYEENNLLAGNDAIELDEDANNKYQELLVEVGRHSFNTPEVLSFEGTKYRMFNQKMDLGLAVLVSVPENQSIIMLMDSLKIYILGIFVIIMAGVFGYVIVTKKFTRPIGEVADRLEMVHQGNFKTKLPEYDSLEFNEISTTFNEMTQYINHLVNEVYEKQLTIKDMELKFFQTQMNPHFMFNVLNTIALQARLDGSEEIFKMIHSFSQLVQAKIYRNGKEMVQLRQELEYVRYYLYLQQFRFGERLTYDIDIKEDALLDMDIPKLCIQLLVENAVVHGIEPKLDQGSVSVAIYKAENSVYIAVKDNGIGFPKTGRISLPIEMKDEDKNHNHVGLNNVHHIIQLMYGEDYGLSIDSSPGCQTCVTVCLPFPCKERGKDKDV